MAGPRRLFCLLLFALLPFLRLMAATGKLRFDHISLNQGLSQSIVSGIIQDRNGFMWFATENGLSRFDGYDFTIYRHDPGRPGSLKHNEIQAIHEDRSGTLWIGIVGGGLNSYDPQKGDFRCFKKIHGRTDCLSNDTVHAIIEDRKGALWIGTDDGLNRLDRRSGRFTVFRRREGGANAGPDQIHALCEDRDGVLWIGADNGLFNFDPRTERFATMRDHSGCSAGRHGVRVYAICEDKDGLLWIGTDSGLDRFDRRSKRCIHFNGQPQGTAGLPHSRVNAIREDRAGMLWIGTEGGLAALDRKTWSFVTHQNDPLDPASLSRNEIRSLYEDRSGILWIGTYGGGVNKLARNQKKFTHIYALAGDPNGISDNIVWSFLEDPAGMLWIGTQSGLDRWDRQKNVFAHFRMDPSGTDPGGNVIRCLLSDRREDIWLGTDGGGIWKWIRGSGEFRNFRNEARNPASLSHDRIRALFQDRDGYLWIGTYGGGLNRMNRDNGACERYLNDENDPTSLSNNVVRSIFQDRTGAIWVGTYGGGLNRFIPATGKFIRYVNNPVDPASLNNDFIFCIHEDRSGSMWIGTWGGGLNRFDREQGTFAHFTREDGLPSNEIYGILEDSLGRLWLSTPAGLSRFDPRKNQFRNFDASDGLQSNEFNGGSLYTSRSGEMFFGGINGFNAFFPEAVSENRHIPPVKITAFKVLNSEVKLPKPIWKTEEILLGPKDYLFSLEFAALDYTAPTKNKYAYKLEGLTPDWIQADARNRVASFSFLPAGKYVFRVKGSNNDGVWNEQGAALVIRVRGPWWRSRWFTLFIIVSLAIIVSHLSRTHMKRVAAKIRTEAALDQYLRHYKISSREKEIISLLLAGKSNKEMEDELFISLFTVKNHIYNIYKKLGIKNRSQLFRLFKNFQAK